MIARTAELDRLYDLLDLLADRVGGAKRLTDPGLSKQCPAAGLYFFFESGELRPNGEPRVVRIGTHALTRRSKTTLWNRLRQHRGQLSGSNPGGGNHRGSIFRHHVGSALLQQRGDDDLLASWRARHPRPHQRHQERALEADVSRVIRAMPFLWLSVPTRTDGTSDRGLMERNYIAMLSTATGNTESASKTWLGRHAVAAKIRQSSLWNVNHVDEQFDPASLNLFEQYIHNHGPG